MVAVTTYVLSKVFLTSYYILNVFCILKLPSKHVTVQIQQ